jgi:hypothetical protein
MVQLSFSTGTLIPINFNHVCIRRSLLGKPNCNPKPADDEWEDDSQY